jgi:phospholipase C
VFKGSISGSDKANLRSSLTYDTHNNGVILGIDNHGDAALKVSVINAYTNKKREHTLKPNGELSEFLSLHSSFGWYDFTITTDSDASFQQRLAGHLETGHDSMTDPAIANTLEELTDDKTSGLEQARDRETVTASER